MDPGHRKSWVLAPLGAFCHEKLTAVMEEDSLHGDVNPPCLGKVISKFH